MIVYWYINRHGSKIGMLNKLKRDRLAEQGYCGGMGECGIECFDGLLINSRI